MRRVAQREDIERFMTALARRAANQGRLYFTGGATAVLLGWRTVGRLRNYSKRTD
jgi:hypothetical protein